MELRIRKIVGLVGLLLLSSLQPALAQLDFGQWLNPGPLASPHESVEGGKNCVACHATAQGVPSRKCLTCHTEIQDKIDNKEGYHARQTKDCVACHSDHKGRAYDISGLSRMQFDHSETGWPLEGGHSKLKCENCHKDVRVDIKSKRPTQRRTYLNSKPECATCHADIHNSQRPELKECQRCHTVDTWKKAKPHLSFNHTRETRYPLTGAHVRVTCYGCHKQKLWAPIAFEKCTNCHADPHKGSFGPNCAKCHTTAKWKGAIPSSSQKKGTFDHDKTAFPLKGEHTQVSCIKCHGPKLGKMPGVNFQQCEGCHNNPHGNQFQILWTKLKVCSDCHLEDGWPMLKFQHNTDSRYTLTDKHSTVPCMQCHVDRKYRWLSHTPDCSSCHFDVHRAQFKSECATCHSTKGFEQVTFDHNKQSRFPLVGKHHFVDCSSCHVEGRFKPLETNCVGCHNDFHKKELGMECRRCHAPIAFNDITFDHNRESKFKLDGDHLKVPCNQCHKDNKYKIGDTTCVTCHNDVHKGAFGQSCERCHTTNSFAVKTGFHDFGEFSLGGTHDHIDCIKCHGDKAPVRMGPTECASCHKDPHMNSMGRNCWSCHNQYAFLPTTFRHNQTGFELSGAHRFLSCNQCHFNRVFGGLPQECRFCHTKDFNPALPQHKSIPANTDCNGCHFTFGWKPSR